MNFDQNSKYFCVILVHQGCKHEVTLSEVCCLQHSIRYVISLGESGIYETLKTSLLPWIRIRSFAIRLQIRFYM